ncbi:unnamed protein product [Polarella glacialis]|uniref:Beta-amylase n=1 Tax=Polarella glacialis TaxID=89957 RepID=A0A813LNY4_POLGL|nr:unnamed protein product [Polarella glacialis]
MEIWAMLITELRVARGLVLVSAADLGRPIFHTAYVSDASMEGYALLETPCSTAEVLKACSWRERWRFVESRSVEGARPTGSLAGALAGTMSAAPGFDDWIADLVPDLSDTDLPWHVLPKRSKEERSIDRAMREVVGRVPIVEACWACPLRWRRVVAGAWRHAGSIHCKEARASLLGLRRAAREVEAQDSIVLSFGDNLSETLAFDRGRARDHELLALVRQAGAIQVATGIRWARRYIETERNPADWDSRLANLGFLLPGQRVHGSALAAMPLSAAVPLNWTAAEGAAVQSNNRDGVVCDDEDVDDRDAAGVSCKVAARDQDCASPSFPIFPPPVCRAPLRDLPGTAFSSTVSRPRPERARRPPTILPRPADAKRGRLSGGVASAVVGPDGVLLGPPSGASMLELFSGTARWVSAAAERGLRIAVPVDFLQGPLFDLTHRGVQREILAWIRLGLIAGVQLGTPCTRWTIARAGSAPNDQCSRAGLACARFSIRVIKLCNACGVPWTLENPASSALWTWKPLAVLLAACDVTSVVFDMCMFGAALKKPSRIAGTLQGLDSLARRCPGSLPHVILQGTVSLGFPPRARWRTSFAAAYPLRLARAWSQLVAVAAGPSSMRPAGQDVLLGWWECRLAAARGGPAPAVLVGSPRLPRCERLGWESAVKQWAGRPLCEELCAWRTHRAACRGSQGR